MAVKAIPEGYHTVTPYIMVKDAANLLQFIITAFDGTELNKHLSPDGKLMHAEVRIGNSNVMLAEASEAYPAFPAMLYLYLPDVDSTYKQAVAAGGKSLREPTNEFYGDRSAGVADAFGNQWWMATHIEDVTPEEMMKRQEESVKKQN